MSFPSLASTLQRMDRLEGYDPQHPASSMYVRKVRPVTLLNSGITVLAYCYIWQAPLPRGSVPLPDGRWSPVAFE